jgi:hypothetical protein
MKEFYEKISWEEFQNYGMLWFINRLLHTFGLAIMVELSGISGEKKIVDVYPVRVSARGFAPSEEERGFIKISEYMVKNSEELLEEAKQ